MEDAGYRRQKDALQRYYLGLGNRAMSRTPGYGQYKRTRAVKWKWILFRENSGLGSSTQSGGSFG